MSCSAAPGATALWDDVHADRPSWSFAGIVGDQAHQARTSSHNCGTGQESALVNPATGRLTDYPDGFAHALDGTYWDDVLGAARIRNATLLGPRKLDVRYIIDHRTNIVYYPEWRGGGTSTSSIGAGHPHLHWSLSPWSTFNTSPWLKREMTKADRDRIVALAKAEAKKRRLLDWKKGRPRQRGRDVAEVQAVLNRPVRLSYGPGTETAVAKFQAFLKLEPTGKVNRPTWEAILFVYLAHGFGF